MHRAIENHKLDKIHVRWPITILTDGGTIDGATINISDSGILLQTKEPLRLHESYRISIKPPKSQNIELTCKVIWADLYGIDPENYVYGIGLCFVMISEKDHRLFYNVISNLNMR